MDETGWDSPAFQAHAEALRARLERPRRLTVEESFRASLAGFWFLGKAETADRIAEPIAKRTEPVEVEVPGIVLAGLARCQKPFHLWNVLREEFRGELAFERGPSYRFGQATKADGEEAGLEPGRVILASRAARREQQELEQARAVSFGARVELRALLSQNLAGEGFGPRDGERQLPALDDEEASPENEEDESGRGS